MMKSDMKASMQLFSVILHFYKYNHNCAYFLPSADMMTPEPAVEESENSKPPQTASICSELTTSDAISVPPLSDGMKLDPLLSTAKEGED